MLPVVFHVPLLVLVSSAFSGLFLFSLFCCLRGSVLCLLVFPWGLSLFVRVQFLFFGIGFLFSVVFSFHLFWLTTSSCFPRSSGFRLFVGFAFPVFPSLAPPCLYPLVFTFCMLRFGIILVVPPSVLSTDCDYGCLFPFFLHVFLPAAVLAVPSCFFPLFSLLCFFLFFGGLRGFSASYASACSSLGRSFGCLPCCGFLFGCTLVVRQLLSMLSAGFLSPNFLGLLRSSSFSLGLFSLGVCSS